MARRLPKRGKNGRFVKTKSRKTKSRKTKRRKRR